MNIYRKGTAVLAAALVAGTGVGAAAAVPASVSAGHAGASTASLGACWLRKLNLGLAEDVNARDYVTRWRGGAVSTTLTGTAPRARSWSLTIYHARRGKIVSFYDQQLTSSSGGTFSLTIGGPKPHSGAWVDPTAGGGDDEGYLILRVYKPSGGTPALPAVSFTSNGPLPPSVTSCGSLSSELSAALTRASKAHPAKGNTVGQTAKYHLWPNNNAAYKVWSRPVDVTAVVPANNVNAVPLLTQLGDPNVVYHAVLFNISQSDMVLHGKLPPISAHAPQTGMRYMSLCAYPTDESFKPLACLDDSNIPTDAHGGYTIVVSPDQPADNSAWLNPGNTSVGAIILRWLLPSQGAKSSFCLPALAYRQPDDTSVPALPPGC